MHAVASPPVVVKRTSTRMRAATPLRCPYCHADHGPSELLVVCRGCFAPQHATCWEDHGRCASCGDRRRIGRRESSRFPAQVEARGWAYRGLLIGLMVPTGILMVVLGIFSLGMLFAEGEPTAMEALFLAAGGAGGLFEGGGLFGAAEEKKELTPEEQEAERQKRMQERIAAMRTAAEASAGVEAVEVGSPWSPPPP